MVEPWLFWNIHLVTGKDRRLMLIRQVLTLNESYLMFLTHRTESQPDELCFVRAARNELNGGHCQMKFQKLHFIAWSITTTSDFELTADVIPSTMCQYKQLAKPPSNLLRWSPRMKIFWKIQQTFQFPKNGSGFQLLMKTNTCDPRKQARQILNPTITNHRFAYETPAQNKSHDCICLSNLSLKVHDLLNTNAALHSRSTYIQQELQFQFQRVGSVPRAEGLTFRSFPLSVLRQWAKTGCECVHAVIQLSSPYWLREPFVCLTAADRHESALHAAETFSQHENNIQNRDSDKGVRATDWRELGRLSGARKLCDASHGALINRRSTSTEGQSERGRRCFVDFSRWSKVTFGREVFSLLWAFSCVATVLIGLETKYEFCLVVCC